MQLCTYSYIQDTPKYPVFVYYIGENALKYPRRIRKTPVAKRRASKVGLCPTSACSLRFRETTAAFLPDLRSKSLPVQPFAAPGLIYLYSCLSVYRYNHLYRYVAIGIGRYTDLPIQSIGLHFPTGRPVNLAAEFGMV
jgi:hypothetical protein